MCSFSFCEYIMHGTHTHKNKYILSPLLSFETGFLCVALAVLEFTLGQGWPLIRDPPASASQVLGLKVCATTAQLCLFVCLFVFVLFLKKIYHYM